MDPIRRIPLTFIVAVAIVNIIAVIIIIVVVVVTVIVIVIIGGICIVVVGRCGGRLSSCERRFVDSVSCGADDA